MDNRIGNILINGNKKLIKHLVINYYGYLSVYRIDKILRIFKSDLKN